MKILYYLFLQFTLVKGYNILRYNTISNLNYNSVSFYNEDYLSNNVYLSNIDKINQIISKGNKHGFLSTLSKSMLTKDFPYGSIVDFSIDEDKKPIFCFSRLSSHTKNIDVNSKSSLLITDNNFNGLQDFRFTLTGNIKKQEDKNYYYDIYYQDHPNDFWIDFDDFSIYKMENITEISFVGGFANAGKIRLKDYLN